MIEQLAGVLIVGLAAWRLAVLVVEDRVLRTPRDTVMARLEQWATWEPGGGVLGWVKRVRFHVADFTGRLLECVACVSVWTAAILTLWWQGTGAGVDTAAVSIFASSAVAYSLDAVMADRVVPRS